MLDQQFYTCKYCYNEFEPKRRRVQKYCSDTCRSKAYHARKIKTLATTNNTEISKPVNSPTPQTQKMSLAGVGNATAGTLAADAIKTIFTKDANKPATKGDIAQIFEKLNSRYHLVKNQAPNKFGQYPYFDLVENVVVYLKL